LTTIIKSKAGLTGGQLFFRSLLCNLLVCLALWMAARAVTDGAKLLVLWWALLAFIAAGFEHSIANMTIFGIGLYTHLPGATASELTRNLLWTVPGNIVGGGLIVGLGYAWLGSPGRFKSPSPEPAMSGATALAAEGSPTLTARIAGTPGSK
jgi:nitrite transporter NirC